VRVAQPMPGAGTMASVLKLAFGDTSQSAP
jgi:hypothetical protein